MLVDVIIIAVVAVFLFIGWKRGFMLSVYSLLSMVIAIVLASVLSPIASSAIEKTGMQDKLDVKISGYIDETLTEKFGENASVSIKEAMDELALPSFVTGWISSGTDSASKDHIEKISHGIASKAADFACTLIAFIIVFIIVSIIMVVIKSVLKVASHLPVLKQADTLGGIIIGFVEGIVFICVLALFLSIFASAQSAQGIVTAVQESYIGSFFYDHNFIGHIISGIL